MAAGIIKPKPKGKPGRPKGSKNKKTSLAQSKNNQVNKDKKKLEKKELNSQQAMTQMLERE